MNASIDITARLSALQADYHRQLPDKIAAMELLLNGLCGSKPVQATLSNLHRMAHSLAGSSGTFGAATVGIAARELESILKSSLDNKCSDLKKNEQQKIKKSLSHLKKTTGSWTPTNLPQVSQNYKGNTGITENNIIFLLEKNLLLADKITCHLEKNGYIVRHFSELGDFHDATKNEVPAAIIMDMLFSEDYSVSAQALRDAENNLSDDNVPIIFISARHDIESRLLAARVGADRYFTKPLNLEKLTQTIDGLTTKAAIIPYRVLLIDDDEELLEFYKITLEIAGIWVKAFSDPLEGLKVLANFNPDLILLDVYMPNYSGTELAQVIRQDDDYAQIPIVFLTTDSNFDQQLAAMSLGGDDFLTKPIQPDHLLASVTTRAKRSRWVNSITHDLKKSVREGESLRIAMDNHDIVSIADVSGKITFVNDRFCNITGYSREELIGQNHRIVKSGNHPKIFFKKMWEMISQGKIWHGTICNIKKDGAEYWVESTIVPFLDEYGVPYKYVSVRTDISELRKNEERLQRSQIFANIGTWDWNILTGELFWSDRIGPLFGYNKKLPKTTYDSFVDAIHPDDRQMVIDAIDACVHYGKDYNVEHRVVWDDGSVHWVQERGDVVRSEDGKALHMLGVVQDITPRKEVETRLELAKLDAESANRAKSQFLSSMSHELRTPMNAIIGFTQLLQMETDPKLTEQQLDNTHEIIKAGHHLLELINEVLDLSKIESGHIDLTIEPVNVGIVVGECLRLVTPLAQKQNIEITTEFNGRKLSLEELIDRESIVRADRTRLKQILLNLLSNAVKYNNANGTITFSCDKVSGNRLRINVTDTGPGISPKDQQHLFQAFNRFGAEQKEIEGTGIGLVITKNIVELMKGSIGVESRVNEGSTFWFELPRDLLENDTELDELKDDTEITQGHYKHKCEHTVLYIEDNPANLRLVTQLLEQRPLIHVWGADEPLLGLELAKERQPDLVLLDINLPNMDGFEVLQCLQQDENTKNIPVIAISANALPNDVEKGMAAGFSHYITKPIDVSAFMAAIDSTFETSVDKTPDQHDQQQV